MMNKKETSILDIDAYIIQFPQEIQHQLLEIRKVIQTIAPQATEKIAYGMPTFHLHKNLVHFAAYKEHIGFYPAPSAIKHFAKELEKYSTSKGAVQFPLHQKLPLSLIKRMVKFRVVENLSQVKPKK